MIPALVIFLATYVFIAGAELPFLNLDRQGAALIGAVAMVVFGVLTPREVVRDAVRWDALILLLGMMILSAGMARAGIFRWVSWVAVRRARGAGALLALVIGVAGALSALLVNDTVCVMLTPLVLAMTEDAGLPPLPFLLGLAFAANAGSVATLTGNPQNMLIGTLSGISYASFASALVLPAALSLACVFAVLRVAFRRELPARARIALHLPRPAVDGRSAAACAVALAVVLAGFSLGYDLSWTAMAGAAVALAATRGPPQALIAEVDGGLLLFFAALFVVTHGVAQAGIAERLFQLLLPWLGSSPVRQTLSFGAFTLAACQLVSNVPFVLLAQHWVGKLADPQLGWLSLAATSTLAGNLTPVASVANLIVLGIAADKARVPFRRFVALGAVATFLPLALALSCLLAERALGLTVQSAQHGRTALPGP